VRIASVSDTASCRRSFRIRAETSFRSKNLVMSMQPIGVRSSSRMGAATQNAVW
jgi:hypothetical protein